MHDPVLDDQRRYPRAVRDGRTGVTRRGPAPYQTKAYGASIHSSTVVTTAWRGTLFSQHAVHPDQNLIEASTYL